MMSVGGGGTESGSKETTGYCRKQKSLGLLCSNFLSLYDRQGIDTVGLDDAASRLGVERRRIYDIVNVLESLGMLTKKAKNKYTWKGYQAIPITLLNLKREGFRDNANEPNSNYSVKCWEDDQDSEDTNTFSHNHKSLSLSVSNPKPPTKSGENRKEKSLGLLTQNFLKLFLCTDMEMISLDDAAKLLLGDGKHTMTTKVRRLYDIANVLSSMKFIEKAPHPETRKPAFRWLGLNGKSDMGSSDALVLKESKKRTFGTDLTNIVTKRYKTDDSSLQSLKHHKHMQNKHGSSTNEDERASTGLKNYEFGPFAPASLPKVGVSGDEKEKSLLDWETLSSIHRPQYHNQALKDLFSHYVEAWESWYTEVGGKNPTQLIS